MSTFPHLFAAVPHCHMTSVFSLSFLSSDALLKFVVPLRRECGISFSFLELYQSVSITLRHSPAVDKYWILWMLNISVFCCPAAELVACWKSLFPTPRSQFVIKILSGNSYSYHNNSSANRTETKQRCERGTCHFCHFKQNYRAVLKKPSKKP